MKANKPRDLNHLTHSSWDAVVIGGGIVGAGVLLDLTTRGFKVLLIEKNDFASGTSSRSTKLIHGGLRYLKQADFKIVKESARERKVLNQLAKHLVKSEKMLLPITGESQLTRFEAWLGLSLYDFLAQVDPHDSKRMLNKQEVLNIEPLLDKNAVRGGGIYSEYRTDDARLVIELIKTSKQKGSESVNYAGVEDFILDSQGHITGVHVIDQLTGAKYEFHGHHFVNATGAWAEQTRKLAGENIEDEFCYTKGSHIVLDRKKLAIKQAIYFQGHDSRMIFVIPRLDRVYIGTTDIFYDGDKLHPQIESSEVNYLIEATNDLFPHSHINASDIISSWSGIRTLKKEKGKSESEISRRDEISQAKSGLISVVGGKLTGYRKMAEKIGDMITSEKSLTHKTYLDSSFKDQESFERCYHQLGEVFKYPVADYLIFNYGNKSIEILKRFLVHENMVQAELEYCLEEEFICHALDFYERRTSRLLFYPESVRESLDLVIDIMGNYYDWSEKLRELNSSEVLSELQLRSNLS